ncbi:hypothetical protein H2204_013209 [Knufia peltigerae]|uniref:Uncharacterized protein n=1 Tax=Knufia peltigerae TaxID=1002370 RepID=A0AA39CS93_9EURO|nr:hypothetical protein H2204_013209 [Knufia peltigerae]
MDPDHLQILQRYSSCDVADALLDLGVPEGGFLPGLVMWSPRQQDGHTRIAGPVWTVEYVRVGKEKQAATDQQPLTPAGHYVDSAPSGSIIFVSCPEDTLSACWGGLVTKRAKRLGVIGTVVDGRMRDLDEARHLDYPVFARQVAVARPTDDLKVHKVNQPVIFHDGHGARTIQPGDVIVADLNGTVLLPAQLLKATIQRLKKLSDVEEVKMRLLDQGISLTEASANASTQVA